MERRIAWTATGILFWVTCTSYVVAFRPRGWEDVRVQLFGRPEQRAALAMARACEGPAVALDGPLRQTLQDVFAQAMGDQGVPGPFAADVALCGDWARLLDRGGGCTYTLYARRGPVGWAQVGYPTSSCR
jgi:hypothetical protein